MKKIKKNIGFWSAVITIFVFIVGKNLPDMIDTVIASKNNSEELQEAIEKPNDSESFGDLMEEDLSAAVSQLRMLQTFYTKPPACVIRSETHILYYCYNTDGSYELFIFVIMPDECENYSVLLCYHTLSKIPYIPNGTYPDKAE